MTPEERKLAERLRGRERRAKARTAKAAKREAERPPELGAILPGYRWIVRHMAWAEWEFVRTFKPPKSWSNWPTSGLRSLPPDESLINAKLDALGCPDADRAVLFRQMCDFWDAHGLLPDIARAE